MTKEKLKSLVVYQSKLSDRLKDPVTPAKHVGHPETYRQFLKNELTTVTKQIEDQKSAALGGK